MLSLIATDIAAWKGRKHSMLPECPACQHGRHKGIPSKLLHALRCPFPLAFISSLHKLVRSCWIKIILVIGDWRTHLPKRLACLNGCELRVCATLFEDASKTLAFRSVRLDATPKYIQLQQEPVSFPCSNTSTLATFRFVPGQSQHS